MSGTQPLITYVPIWSAFRGGVINATASKSGRSFRRAAPKVPSVSPLALSPRLVQVDAGSSQSCLCHSPSDWQLFNPMLTQSQCSLEFARLYFWRRHRGKGTRARPTWTLPHSGAVRDPPTRCSVKQSPAGRGRTTIVILPATCAGFDRKNSSRLLPDGDSPESPPVGDVGRRCPERSGPSFAPEFNHPQGAPVINGRRSGFARRFWRRRMALRPHIRGCSPESPPGWVLAHPVYYLPRRSWPDNVGLKEVGQCTRR